MRKDYKRLFVGSDSHCGHKVGLTPQKYQTRGLFEQWEQTQSDLWEWYKYAIDLYKPFDIAILNGDLIDGKSRKDGGQQLITTDRLQQAQIAYDAFSELRADKYIVIAGTPYHGGENEMFEKVIVELLLKAGHDAEFHETFAGDINGRRVHARHHVSGSGIPHGATTPLNRELVNDILWGVKMEKGKPDLFIRSHTHLYTPTEILGCTAFVTPALMALGDNYGSMRVSKLVDIGFVVVDIPNEKEDRIRCTPVMPKVMLKK